jgi:predicted lysophospholipase L1 biosynthesis ABC-type transport system permease subunit
MTHNGLVSLALEILILIVVLVPSLLVLTLFIAAARRDGEEDEALQRRLGIRRRTRMGR